MSSLAIRCVDLRKRYGGVVAVDGLELEVERGICFGLLGPNGAGKTTSVEMMEGLTDPSSGTIEILGRGWAKDGAWLRERVGVTLQETRLQEELTVAETIDLYRSFYEKPRTRAELLDMVALHEKAQARLHTLSGGQKQRVAVACGLAGHPELLFLDEPSTGLDPQSRRHMWDVITAVRASGTTVLLTTHYMEEAERVCDRVAIVDRGRVIALGTPRALIAEHIGGELIELELKEGSNAEQAFAGLHGKQGVHAVTPTGTRCEILVERIADGMRLVNEAAAAGSVEVVRLSTRTPDLEDVFVKLTGRPLRG